MPQERPARLLSAYHPSSNTVHAIDGILPNDLDRKEALAEQMYPH